jgi:hypothetical protein
LTPAGGATAALSTNEHRFSQPPASHLHSLSSDGQAHSSPDPTASLQAEVKQLSHDLACKTKRLQKKLDFLSSTFTSLEMFNEFKEEMQG